MTVVAQLVLNAIGALPLLAALLVVRAVNTRREHRARHFPLPFAALLYAALATLLLYRFQAWFGGLLDAVFRQLPFLEQWYRPDWLFTLENVVVLIVFAAAKLIASPVLARLVDGEHFRGSAVVAEAYEFDAEEERWFLKRRLGDLRVLLRAVYWVSVVVALLLDLLAHMYPHWAGFRPIAYPAIPVLLLGECFFALDGLTRPEFEQDLTGEADDARRVTRYSGLRRILKEVFGDRLLAMHLSAGATDAVGTHDRLDALLHSSDDLDRIAGAYFQRVKQSGEPVDANLLGAAVDLLHSTSAVINDPFYPDLTRYLAFPAYHHLLQYKKVLIVAGRDAIAEDLAEWMRRGLEAITGVPELWTVDVLQRPGQDGLDLGVLRVADLHDLELIRNNDDFLAAVEYVILAEPSRLLATGQLGLGLVLSRCGRERRPVFAAFDRNHDGLVDALSHLLKTEMTEVVASALPTGTSVGAIWRATGPSMTATILPRVTRYLGVGTEIAAVALKHQVSEVTWVGAERFPVTDMGWIAGQYYQPIAAFAELEQSQQSVQDAIRPWSNPWDLPQADHRFLVVEDEFANAYESLRLYSTRARKQGFVNLISDDYLLRDYMIDNAEIFSADPKAIPSIAPDYARTERNSVLRLLLSATAFGVTLEAIAKEFEIVGVPVPKPDGPVRPDAVPVVREPAEITVLSELIRKHTGLEPRFDPSPATTEDEPDDAQQQVYRLSTDLEQDALLDALRPAYFFVENEVADENTIGAQLFCHVYQAVLPGQFVTYGGKYYEVQGVGSSTYHDGVVLRRAAEHITDRRRYRQLRRYSLGDLVPDEPLGARRTVGAIEIIRSSGSVTVETDGYIELTSRSETPEGRIILLHDIPQRSYRHKAVLQIRLPDVPAETRRTIAGLLNEVFVTVFPHAHQYVVALTDHDEPDLLLPGLTLDRAAEESIYIVEDSLIDLGLLVAVERSWQRLLAIVTDYLDWRSGSEPEPHDEIQPTGDPTAEPDPKELVTDAAH